MFKIESYITPVILSYVEKYVKNFKPEQSQVSLWGGDATFQNLDLRLEVLEEQLNLPFTFVSGHIHELIIHVPWVKITSEPIVVTINTIECILNLKDQALSERSGTSQQGAGVKTIQVESPSSYIKSIVTKVINNITINCNNLILKYVEEDIVLSVNVRFLSMQTVNEAWEPVFADVSSSEVTLRKIIAVEDLTLCLDKMDTAGKIEVYQDPVLYRCSMMIRLMMNYHSNSTKFASLTRFDLHCEKMEFSMTEQQLPMLLRLITLITSPRRKQPNVRTEKSINTTEERGDVSQDAEDEIRGISTEGPSWGGWAWNTVTSILPVNWDPDWSDESQVSSTGHMIHMSVFIDEAVLTFKTVEALQEQLFYKSRKIRYNSFLMVRVTSAIASMLVKGVDFTNLQFGLGSVRLEPQGPCSCGHQEIVDYMQPPVYIEAGKILNGYLKDSLFDSNFIESSKLKNYYNEYDLEYHLATVNAMSMLEKSPAFGIDIVHVIEVPEDLPEEKIHEFESNFEYSNFLERKVTRYVIGDLKIQLCKGFMHRIHAVEAVAKNDYNFNVAKKTEPNFEDLPPVTVEEYEALRETVSMIETYFNIHRFSIHFLLTDHSVGKQLDFHPLAQIKIDLPNSENSRNPDVSFELNKIEGSIIEPMYAFRLASCASRQEDIAPEMLKDCYININVTVSEIQSQLRLNKNCRTTIVMPSNATLIRSSLIYPQYWRQKNINHELTELVIDDITFTGTKAKLMVAAYIVMSIVDPTATSNPLFCSSLFTDACNEKDPVYLELSLENVECKRIKSPSTTSIKTNVKSIKAFALNDTQQAFILSGPENDIDREEETSTLFTAIFQYSETNHEQTDPIILSFKVSEMRGSLDPLLYQWLQYQATYKKSSQTLTTRPEAEAPIAGETLSDTDVRKKIFRSLHESVHSLSDKEKRRSSSRTDWSKGISGVEESAKKNPVTDDNDMEEPPKTGTLVRIAQMYPFWRKLVLAGSIGHFVMYLPTTTMDGIGVAGIESAKDRALNSITDLHIFAIRCPTIIVHSVNSQFEKLVVHFHELPVSLPPTVWSLDYHSFPWTLKLNNLSCYTMKKDSKTNFIRKLDFTATIDVTTKSDVTDVADYSHAGLGLCVYVDTSPIIVSLSEEQIVILKKASSEIMELINVYHSGEKMCEPPLSEIEACYFEIPKTPSSYNPVVYPENTTSPSSISTARESSDQAETENPVITAMIQWTITKISIKLYTIDQMNDKLMKLLLEFEDIITTFDWQSIYLKFKNKITTANISHFSRDSSEDIWKLGDYAGLILLGRESSLESEDVGFASITYTKAQSGNVHTRWGAQRHRKSQKIRSKRECPLSTDGYITEIDMNLQRIDLILPPSVLNKFLNLLKPLMESSAPTKTLIDNDSRPFLRCDNFENRCLPLIYLEFKGMNLMLPTSEDFPEKLNHDLLMIQLDGVSITPTTENPICRTILRSDIYQLAAQSNILNIPGSSVEDRQYQIIVKGICACTTTWHNYQQNVPKRTSQSFLYTMNENPALEWNNLSSDNNLEMQNSTSILMSSIDLRLIIAPAVILHPSKIICGGAFELTCLTNIDLAVNLDQMKLLWRIQNEMCSFMSDYSNKNRDDMSRTDMEKTVLRMLNDSHEIQSVHTSKDQETNLTGDSGIDFESSIANYASTRKITVGKTPAPLPLEILINCGSVAISLNTLKNVSIDDNISTSDVQKSVEFPIFYLTLVEPNVYISRLNEKEMMRISCFDIDVSLGNNNEEDKNESKLPLIETKSGSLHPDTGIPPSFITVKSEKNYNTSTELFIDVGRPIKINCSMLAVKNIDFIKKELMCCFEDKTLENKTNDSAKEMKKIENPDTPKKFNLPEMGFKTKQLVLCLVTSSGLNILASAAKLSGQILRTVKSEKIHGNLRLETLVVSAQDDQEIKTFLSPSTFDIAASLFWETWQNSNDEPQIRIQAYSEAVQFELGLRQIQMLRNLIDEYQNFVNYTKVQSDFSTDKNIANREVTEQNYKDDLKAGAFQFVNGNYEEMPSPYQVVFYMYPEKGMAWKYPQPRMITGLYVSPIPFEISDEVDLEEEPLTCSLEYWSESHKGYRNYVEFELSERDHRQVDLPKLSRGQAVSTTWRVLMKSRRSEREASDYNMGILAPQVLVGCLRIDSYFNAALVPNVQISLNVGVSLISVMNQITASTYEKLPEPLMNFRLNRQIPENQCFLELEKRETSIVLNRWSNGAILVDIASNVNVRVLNYDFLHMDRMIDNLEVNAQISFSEEMNVSVECNPVTIKFGASIAHTLTLSTNLWFSLLEEKENSCASVPLTRIVVANDSNIPIKFGQTNTNDDYLLQSRECHFYFWRRASNRTLRIGVYNSEWIWSERLSLQMDGKRVVRFPNSSGIPSIFAKVVSITPTQKVIIISGLLIVTNRLLEHVQMKLVTVANKGNSQFIDSNEMYWINGYEQLPSIALENVENVAMRLRFASSANLAWTGDIPLKANSKFGQPWLVKVPLRERGQFLSIWVRIVEEIISGEARVLAVISPLYMIKSYLPVPVVIKIKTPSLSTSSNATITGQGKAQQLYCPGTFEHCHQLTFQFESSTSASDPYVPLSYNSVEEKTFFARPRHEDIDAILADLEKPEKATYLPFPANHSNVKIPPDQPQTHVQIKYRDAGLVSSTLLLELQPWCFVFNTLGCQVTLIAEDIELCQIPHNGIVTPPKLEGTFHLRITIENNEYVSPALQLARPDWNPGFYMPRIRGLVPVEGSIQTPIECGSQLCVITINSKMYEDMRIVRIMASHVISNCTSQGFDVSCFAVGETSSDIHFPENDVLPNFQVSPKECENEGAPIVQWRILDAANTLEHEALYISLRRDSAWSCPVRVDKKNTSRRGVAVMDTLRSVPLIVTTHEDNGVTYILLHSDDHPQLHVENGCPFPVLLGEANGDSEGVCDETSHFDWKFKMDPEQACYYSTPSYANRMPDSQTTETLPKLRLSILSSSQSSSETTDKARIAWSRIISFSQVNHSRLEQHVRLPVHGDIKLLMEKRCHIIYLRVVNMSQIEVSVHDIRTRLILEENKSPQMLKSHGLDERDLVANAAEILTSTIAAKESEGGRKSEEIEKTSPDLKTSETSESAHILKGSLTLYMRGINITIMQDINENSQRNEIASLSLSDVIMTTNSHEKALTMGVCIGDLQLDNQMFDQGGYDFPVVFMSQNPYTKRGRRFYVRNGSRNRLAEIESQALVVVDCSWEVNAPIYACTKVNIKIGPVSAYIEDTFISQLLEYTTSTASPCLNVPAGNLKRRCNDLFPDAVVIPEHILLDSTNLRSPLRLERFTIEPISVLLSVHTSIRLYVALDHSPLYFGGFEKEHLFTTASGLANALTMHYISGALFGAGWVVGSLEILGSPGGFAQALGSGLKDFVTLPIQGILNGPWSFLTGITQGSASLVKHLTAGTVNSVTKLASSVARNLDRLTLDNEHLQRQEESRRTRPQGMAQGLYQGLTGFGMSLLAAVAGLAHHPLQQVLSGEVTPRGLVTGVGLGIVGAVTKPLSGAAELVALTGQGLLEGTGWNPLPTPRQRPTVESVKDCNNSLLKCVWRLLPSLGKNASRILYMADANYAICEAVERRVILILTRQSLILADMDEGSIEKIYSLRELTSVEHIPDPTILCLYCLQNQNPPERSTSPIEYPEMDQAMRVRVEQFVRGSSSSFGTYQQSDTIELLQSNPNNTLTFYIEPVKRNYFLSLFEAAKRQDQASDFIVL